MKHVYYTVVDYFTVYDEGSFSNLNSKARKAVNDLAYKTLPKYKTYKLKDIQEAENGRKINGSLNVAQKKRLRLTKQPKQVIAIVDEERFYYISDDIFPTTYAREGKYMDLNNSIKNDLDIWAEKVEDLTVILCKSNNEIEVIDYIAEFHPEWCTTKHFELDKLELENLPPERYTKRYLDRVSKYRRCALIWANALGWEFSAPLFKENNSASSELYVRNKVLTREIPEESYSKLSKVSTRPENFLNSKKVASEEECKAFFEHYKWLQMNGLLADSLEPDYHLCPTCGRPLRGDVDSCTWCDEQFETTTLESFWDDSYNDEDDDLNYEPTKAIAFTESEVLARCGDICTADLATKKYKTYLADCKVRDNNYFYFPEANEVEKHDYNHMVLMSADKSDDNDIKKKFYHCDPEGDSTIHQLWWYRILEDEKDNAYIDGLLKRRG